MHPRRFVGLSNKQSVPPLLSVISRPTSTKNMKDIDVDAPPVSDLSDSDGPATRGDIQPTHFVSSSRGKSPSTRGSKDPKDGKANKEAAPPANRSKRTRASARPVSGSNSRPRPRGTESQPDAIDTGSLTSSPAPKRPKKSSPGDPPAGGERGSQFVDDMFAPRKHVPSRHKYGKSNAFGNKAKQRTSPTKRVKAPPKEATPESPDRFKLKLPSVPREVEETGLSPTRKFKAIPFRDFDVPENPSPVSKKRLKMPSDDGSLLSGKGENTEASQRPVFKIPDALPDSFYLEKDGRLNIASSQITEMLNSSDLLRASTSTPTDLELLDSNPVCPFCKKPVYQEDLDRYTANYPTQTVGNMQRFCDQHRLRSAKETWEHRGYPDIDWHRLEGRIAEHYRFLGDILADTRPSHYRNQFAEMVRSGRNRTLFRSDANLTPGYYGIRGLRAMTEQLICALAPLLRERAVEDRLVSARGVTMFLQSVLVPELTVRLIMEDMDVGEEEARRILEESTEVGDLLNDEIPDVVSPDSDDESEGFPS